MCGQACGRYWEYHVVTDGFQAPVLLKLGTCVCLPAEALLLHTAPVLRTGSTEGPSVQGKGLPLNARKTPWHSLVSTLP